MKRLIALSIFLIFFLSQVTLALADYQNASKQIERIETTENSRTTYYTDGSKEVFVTSSLNINFGASAGTAHVIGIPAPPPSVPFEKVIDILKEIVDGISRSIGVGFPLLAWKIWNTIRGLRRNRPKDYNDVS